MHEDRERCVRAVQSKDARFDGWFFTAVTSTGIYCRPSCPVVPPKVANMVFYPSAAAAQGAGFRACKRCRPDASAGSPEWNQRADVVARAVRLIADGVVDQEGVNGLADRLGYSVRQVQRQVTAELGAGPLALARAQRAQTARLMTETTDWSMTDVALAAGFSSVRAFNQTVREVFGLTPSELRARRAGGRAGAGSGTPGSLSVRLPFRGPLCPESLFAPLAADAVPGVEEWRDGAYRRTLRLAHGPGTVTLWPPPHRERTYVECTLALADFRDLTTAISRCRRLLDLDADPVAVAEHLATDPALEPLVTKEPGRRVARTVDPGELALRTVLAQDEAEPTARAAQLVAAHGDPVTDPDGALTHLFPTPATVAALDPDTLPLPGERARALTSLAGAVAAGDLVLDAGADWDLARARLRELPGISASTVETIAMRGLGDPDACPYDGLAARSRDWSPWRSYAVAHLLAGNVS